MAPLARLTTAAVGVEVEAGWMKEWEETGDEVPPRHQSTAEEKKGLEGEVKACCSGIKSKLLLHLAASRQKQHSHKEKRRKHHRKWEREKRGFIPLGWPNFTVCTSESDQESVQLALNCWQIYWLSLWVAPIINQGYFLLCSLSKLWLHVDICLVGELPRDSPIQLKNECLESWLFPLT